jgi:hypothetical protein
MVIWNLDVKKGVRICESRKKKGGNWRVNSEDVSEDSCWNSWRGGPLSYGYGKKGGTIQIRTGTCRTHPFPLITAARLSIQQRSSEPQSHVLLVATQGPLPSSGAHCNQKINNHRLLYGRVWSQSWEQENRGRGTTDVCCDTVCTIVPDVGENLAGECIMRKSEGNGSVEGA